MGLTSAYLDYIYESAVVTIGDLRGKRMLELGNQHIIDRTGVIHEKTGKEYYANKGVEHTSIDLNGLDGAIKVDLSKPIGISGWREYFDIVTNSGTSEHVSPRRAQYECFMNIHDCLKVGGIAVHLVPDINELENKGCWKNHCTYYYSHEFVEMLVRTNKYKLISLRMIDGLVCFCVEKTESIPFMKNREEFLRYIETRESGMRTALHDSGWYIRFRSSIQNLREKM